MFKNVTQKQKRVSKEVETILLKNVRKCKLLNCDYEFRHVRLSVHTDSVTAEQILIKFWGVPSNLSTNYNYSLNPTSEMDTGLTFCWRK